MQLPQQQQQQQPFLPPHMQQQPRKYNPNELSPAAAATFEHMLQGMLPPDWRQMNSWFSLDARVKFTVNGLDQETVQRTKQLYDTCKQGAIAGTAEERDRVTREELMKAAMRVVQPTSVYVTGLAGSRPPQQHQQWVGQAGHPAVSAGGVDYSQQQQQYGAGADDVQDDDDLDEMLGLLNVGK
jgi:hypothetical protein